MSALDDDLDYQILKLLQKDGRMSFTEISKEINVAVSTIRHRYINLVEDGTLKIIGRIDPNKIGFNAYSSIMISVKPKSHMNAILTSLTKLPEISFLATGVCCSVKRLICCCRASAPLPPERGF